jgi:hypothetical protein
MNKKLSIMEKDSATDTNELTVNIDLLSSDELK